MTDLPNGEFPTSPRQPPVKDPVRVRRGRQNRKRGRNTEGRHKGGFLDFLPKGMVIDMGRMEAGNRVVGADWRILCPAMPLLGQSKHQLNPSIVKAWTALLDAQRAIDPAAHPVLFATWTGKLGMDLAILNESEAGTFLGEDLWRDPLRNDPIHRGGKLTKAKRPNVVRQWKLAREVCAEAGRPPTLSLELEGLGAYALLVLERSEFMTRYEALARKGGYAAE